MTHRGKFLGHRKLQCVECVMVCARACVRARARACVCVWCAGFFESDWSRPGAGTGGKCRFRNAGG